MGKHRYGKAKNQRNSDAPTLRRFDAPTPPRFKPLVGMGDKKEGADAEKHIGTHKSTESAESTKNTESTEGTEKTQRKRKKAYGLRNEEGGETDGG